MNREMAVQMAPKLRWVLSGAEAMPPDLLSELRSRLPQTHIFFGYGPTEASEHVSCTTFNPSLPPELPILVGKPIPNTHIYILDQHHELVPVGVPGHLFASGPCLARGYLKLPEKTDEAFVDNTVDPSAGPRFERMYGTGDLCRWSESGQIQILGRIDRQVCCILNAAIHSDEAMIFIHAWLLPPLADVSPANLTRQIGAQESDSHEPCL